MKLHLDTHPIDQTSSIAIFREKLEPGIREYLLTDCILDNNGIERVMAQLLDTYLKGRLSIVCQLQLTQDESNHSDFMKSNIQGIADSVGNYTIEITKNFLFAAAQTLALLDSAIHRRKLH